MSLGAHSLGAFYLGGAPYYPTGPKTITVEGDCTLNPATCSGTMVVPERVQPQTVTHGGVFPLPLRRPVPKPRGRVTVTGSLTTGPVQCAGKLARRHRHKITGNVALAAVTCAGDCAVTESEDEELYSLVLESMDPGARFGVLLDSRWR